RDSLRSESVPEGSVAWPAPPGQGDRHLADSEPVPLFRLRSTSGTDFQTATPAHRTTSVPSRIRATPAVEQVTQTQRSSHRVARRRDERRARLRLHPGGRLGRLVRRVERIDVGRHIAGLPDREAVPALLAPRLPADEPGVDDTRLRTGGTREWDLHPSNSLCS